MECIDDAQLVAGHDILLTVVGKDDGPLAKIKIPAGVVGDRGVAPQQSPSLPSLAEWQRQRYRML